MSNEINIFQNIQEKQNYAETLSKMGDRLEISIKMLAVIWATSSIPLKFEDLKEASEEILKVLIRELGEIQHCSILLYDEVKDLLILYAARGRLDILGESVGPYNKNLTFKPGEGIAGNAFIRKEPLFFDSNFSCQDIFLNDDLMIKPESLMCLPLNTPDKCIGILNISFNIAKEFDNTRQRHFIILSGVIANVLQMILLRDELRLNAQSLIKSENKYRSILESIDEGYYELNCDGAFTFFNDSMCKILGYSSEELRNLNIFDIVCTSNRLKIRNLLEDVRKSGHAIRSDELEFLKKDKSKGYFEISFSLIRNSQNDIFGYRGIAQNVTDRKKVEEEKKQLEKKLIQAQKMEAIGRLAGGVAHDLNNVLAGLVSYPDLILLELPEDSPLKDHISIIKKSGEKAAKIVQDLLTLARRGVEISEIVNLNQVILELFQSPEYEKILSFHPNIKVKINLDNNLSYIRGSIPHLYSSILNLISNSAEAMIDGGLLTIETKNYIEKKAINFDKELYPGDYISVSISDTGIGISKDDIEKIFEPFYTKKKMGRSGTGLGMSVVWGTVKDHNGFIDVASSENAGTTITILFPVATKKTVQFNNDHNLNDLYGRGESVLVVDDLDDQKQLAVLMLTKLGYQVDSVSSGEEAIDYINENKTDLVVLDMIMDPGINGLETYKRILKINPRQKAIIVSGYSDKSHIYEASKLGINKYVKKPYLLEDIGQAVKEELNK